MNKIRLSENGKYKELNQFALVDSEDYEHLIKYKWHIVKPKTREVCYAATRTLVNGKVRILLMHRLIMQQNDPKILIDHKDKNGINNQKSNLRIATFSENAANRISCKNSTSKYLGVMWDKSRGKWRAEIRKNGKYLNVGRFVNEKDAAIAYNQKAIQMHGRFASLNNI